MNPPDTAMPERSDAAPPVRERLGSDAPIELVREILGSDAREQLDPRELLTASEIAYRTGDFAVAAKAMCLVVAAEPNDPLMRHRLGLCLEAAGAVSQAEREFRESLRLDPMSEAAYASLVNTQLAQGNPAGAALTLELQCERVGPTLPLVRALVECLVMAGDPHRALSIVERYNDDASATDDTLLLESELAVRAGRVNQAICAAYMAWKLRRESSDLSQFLASLLCNVQRFESAILVLRHAAARDPDNIRVANLLAMALAETGDYEGALEVLTRLIRLEPTSSDLWHRAAILALQLGGQAQAIALMRRALAIAPHDANLHVAMAHLYSHVRRFDEAVTALDRAHALAPGDASARDLRLVLVQEREREGIPVSPESTLVRPVPRMSQRDRLRSRRAQQGGLPRLVEGVRVQWRVIAGLVMRDLSHRTIYSRLGLASAVIEPFIQIAMLGLVLSIFTHSRPPLGNDIFFFYTTGVLPFYIFIHVVNHSLNIFVENQSVLQVPIIRRLDLVVASCLAGLLIDGTTATIVFIAFYLLGQGSFGDHTLDAVLAYFIIWLFASGVALNVAVLNNFSRLTERAWQTVQRVLYFVSGIFFVASGMPDWIRAYLVWNPLLVAVEWFRSGFFPQYSPPWLDRSYVVVVSCAVVIVGLMMERTLRRRLRTA